MSQTYSFVQCSSTIVAWTLPLRTWRSLTFTLRRSTATQGRGARSRRQTSYTRSFTTNWQPSCSIWWDFESQKHCVSLFSIFVWHTILFCRHQNHRKNNMLATPSIRSFQNQVLFWPIPVVPKPTYFNSSRHESLLRSCFIRIFSHFLQFSLFQIPFATDSDATSSVSGNGAMYFPSRKEKSFKRFNLF